MEVKSRRKYSKEFKEDVMNMLKTGDKSVKELSKELGIADPILYRWYKKSNESTGIDSEKLSAQEKDIRELRRKLAEITEERDILKKAVSIFSKQGISK